MKNQIKEGFIDKFFKHNKGRVDSTMKKLIKQKSELQKKHKKEKK